MNSNAFWHLTNALACGAIAYLVGFPRVEAGRHLSLRTTIARTLVASMAAGISVSIVLHHYVPQLEVILNLAIAFAAYARHGDIIADSR